MGSKNKRNEKNKSTFWSSLLETPKSQYEQQKTKMDVITKDFNNGPFEKMIDLPFTYQSCTNWAQGSQLKRQKTLDLNKCGNAFLKGIETYKKEFVKYAKEFREGMERFRKVGDAYFEAPKDW